MENNSISAEKEYIVEPWTDTPSSCADNLISPEPLCFQKSINYIKKRQSKIHEVKVDSGANYLEVDLNWGDKNDKLRLITYTPSGSKLETNRDNADGRINGRIHVNILPSKGDMQQGTWQFKIYGEDVSGKEGYSFNVYQH
ncbi:hypothetical protein EQO05_15080 [Methanosarcina sp. MSH10X1]|nr:hypothetical protein EQO05_15080 [Methanosarcina sp. MSH10X1]